MTPGAAEITGEAAKKPTVNAEAVEEELMPWLKNDISSSEPSNPGTPSQGIELGEIIKPEEAAQMDPEPEQLFHFHDVQEVHDEVDAEHPPSLNIEIEDDRGRLSIAYQNY